MPLIPAFERQRQADLWVPGQPGLQSEFQEGQPELHRETLSQNKQTNKQTKNQQKKANKVCISMVWGMLAIIMVSKPFAYPARNPVHYFLSSPSHSSTLAYVRVASSGVKGTTYDVDFPLDFLPMAHVEACVSNPLLHRRAVIYRTNTPCYIFYLNIYF